MILDREFKAFYNAKNVNSKRLLKEIINVVEQICNEYIVIQPSFFDSTFDYSQMANFLELYFHDLTDKKVITQFDIIADARNNNDRDVRAGYIKTTVKFKQFNCLNETQVDFVFKAQ